MKTHIYSVFIIGLCTLISQTSLLALDFPHNDANTISCPSCHITHDEDTTPVPQDIDDTEYNNLCWSCHNDIIAPYVRTHSSLQIDNGYGNWTVECIVCHDAHEHQQFSLFGQSAEVYSGVLTSAGTDTLTEAGAGWAVDQFAGYIVYPDVSNDYYNYKILSNTEDTLTVTSTLESSVAQAGKTFSILYGKLVRATVNTPNSGDQTVRFFAPEGANSFADGDTTYDGICEICHTQTDHFRNDGLGGDQLHSNMGAVAGTRCTTCHRHINGFAGMGGGAHPTHVTEGYGPQLVCADCHGANTPPLLADGQDLANTTVCDNCHSADGLSDAKSYWGQAGSSIGTSGAWGVEAGEEAFCGSCHDATPGNSSPDGGGTSATNIMGDASTYGFYVTGHGLAAGNYSRLSWQDTAANGNPAANQGCSACHDLSSQHFGSTNSRLKAGFENDAANSNCKQCHAPGTVATSVPEWYTTYTDYESSAHSSQKCTDCHNVHGTGGAYLAMTTAQKESLCYSCHTEGGVMNNSISTYDSGSHDGSDNTSVLVDSSKSWTTSALVGKTVQNFTDGSSGKITGNDATSITAALSGGTENDWDSQDEYNVFDVDDIQQSFGLGTVHNLGSSFSNASGDSYTLECVSCHNVHIITGRYWDAGTSGSPVSRFSANTAVWGDEAGEKMDDYAGTGTYRTPNGDYFSGAELPDYSTFCLDCHGQSSGSSSFGISWSGDPHGTQSANQPNGYGTCPNWYSCGKASGWSGDDCTASDPADCWPVMTRGKGDQIWSRGPYNHEERIAGANFTLSCTDCHEAHGSNNGSMLRTDPNNGTGSTTWNTMCNNCHYYYSDWHAGMSCGNASCHVTNSIHRASNMSGSGSTRSFDADLVLHYAFEGNLKDSGSWQMDGKWMDDIAGSYVSGKVGNGIEILGGKNVQVGTEDAYWSTDAGKHGTHIYTEMKFNTTLEAWVYPTDDTASEYSIFTKHVGYGSGGYAFTLYKVSGGLRAAFVCQIDNNSTDQDGMAGVRGAYSWTALPLNTWSHVAATFDSSGADRDDNDPSVGRIRIYVNGEDVTTSDSSGNFMQPGAGETSIFAYPENSPWNESICYNGNWCTGEFSVGGFYGWQNEFIGRLDEAKVWNITKDSSYFATADQDAGPFISSAKGLIGNNELLVTFSEGIYAATGQSGALDAADFVLTDTDGNNPRSITNVAHVPGDSTATLTMSAALSAADIDSDILAPASSSIFDEYDNPASAEGRLLGLSESCPSSPVTFDLDESPGSVSVSDSQGILFGSVSGADTLTGSEFYGTGDGDDSYIDFQYNTSCLQATTAMTLQARVKPTGMTGTANYIRRVLARDSGGNYQMSVWRNNGWSTYNAPDGEASIALWVKPADAHSGNAWKVVLTNYTGAATGTENECPIVSDHWYQIKVVWDTNKAGGAPGEMFLPADIYVDDQGTDGADSGENWAGSINCTDSDQTLMADAQKFYTGDEISSVDGNFAIGANRSNPANNLFNGLIDWIVWQDSVQ